ncbi:MAG: hypothetical protein CYPHOPRED_002107 [Cyphobasidiales sp. Tagirdzhanova-0007]|nr:MAG: hypothetical protein CYPHOPRED_002107 [Cyphobasidiales sp. Tagirdzhanova-0007]
MAAARSTPLIARGHTRPVNSLAFSPFEGDGQHYLLVSSCKDGTPMLRDGSTGKIWDATDGNCLLTLPHEHIVRCVDLNGDGSRAITGGHEKKLRLWNIQQLLADPATVSSSSSLASSSREFTQDNSKSAHDGVIKSVVWDERNNQIISAGEDRCVKFWDLDSFKCIHIIETDAPITSMERCHDERGTISLTYGNVVDFIDPESLPYPPSTASLHPVLHDRFVTGSTADGWVRVNDAKTGEEKEVYKGHHGPVHAVSYSPDGELYASGSEDGTIRLWQTSPKTYGLWKYEANGVS